MGLNSAYTNTPKWFEHWTRASKNVIDAMSEEERKTLEEEAERMWLEGLPVDMQWKSVSWPLPLPLSTHSKYVTFRLAEEKWCSQFTLASKQFYSEVGLVSISILAFTGKTGNCYDFKWLRQSSTVISSKVCVLMSLEEYKSKTCIVLLGLRARVQEEKMSIKD